MTKVKIVQQGTDLSAIGGLSSEFKRLSESSLNDKYDMIPMVLPKVHRMVNLSDIRYYYSFLKKVKPDIVQIRGAQIDGLNAQIAARMVPGIKVLVCVHGMFSELVYLSPIKKMIHTYIVEPIIFRLCDGISCVYQKGNERKQLRKYRGKLLPYVYNRMPDRIETTPEQRMKTRHECNIPENAIVGVFCGRFGREKGLTYLLDALKNMKDRWPQNFHMLMIGDGEYLSEFKQAIKSQGMSSTVHCVGAREDVKPLLSASDFFIMPSLHENHSIALLEAMAAGLPCIATDVGGNSEIVRNGIEGILCKPFDSKELEENIIQMVLNHGVREEFSNNILKNKFEQFSPTAVDKQLDLVYQLLLRK
jgi:glycosyltransferase involved in cell wall biosynthesis